MKKLIFWCALYVCLMGCKTQSSDSTTSETDTTQVSGPDATPITDAPGNLDALWKGLTRCQQYPSGSSGLFRLLIISDGEFASDSSSYFYDKDFTLRYFQFQQQVLDAQGSAEQQGEFLDLDGSKPLRSLATSKISGKSKTGVLGSAQGGQWQYYNLTFEGELPNVADLVTTVRDNHYQFDIAGGITPLVNQFKRTDQGFYEFTEVAG